MKKLRQYNRFDIEAFLSQKTIVVGAIKPASDTDKEQGYNFLLKGMILDDPANDGINTGENLTIKLKSAPNIQPGKQLKFSGSIALKNAYATVYGDYGNMLSVKADALVSGRKEA